MKNLRVFSVLVLGLIVSMLQAGWTYGCPGMYYGHRYDGEVYSPDYRTWYGSWQKSSYYEELSSKQKKELRNLKQKFKKKTIRLRKDIHAKQLGLRALRLEDKPDLKKIDAKLKEISELEEQLEKSSDEYRTEIRKILPEEATEYLSNWTNYYWDWSERYCPMW